MRLSQVTGALFVIALVLCFEHNAAAQPRWEWSRAYADSSHGFTTSIEENVGFALAEYPDGSWLLAGTSHSDSTGRLTIWRVDRYGIVQWRKDIVSRKDSAGIAFRPGVGTVLARPGGFIMAGSVNFPVFPGYQGPVYPSYTYGGDGFIASIDTAGNVLWSHCIGGTGLDIINRIIPNAEGGYFFVGYSNSPGVPGLHYLQHSPATNVWIGKLDSLGNPIWMHDYGGTGLDIGLRIAELADHSIAVVARAMSPDGDITVKGGYGDRMWLLHLDSIGTILWDKSWGAGWSDPIGVLAAKDGGMIAAGTKKVSDDSAHNSSELRTFIEKIAYDGSIVWADSIAEEDRTTSPSAMPYEGMLALTPRGEVILASIDNDWITSDGLAWLWLAKFDPSGKRRWFEHQMLRTALEGRPLWYPIPTDLSLAADGGFAITGTAYLDSSATMPSDQIMFAARFPADPKAAVAGAANQADLDVFPNPATTRISVAIANGEVVTLCNALGEQVDRIVPDAAGSVVTFDVSHLPRGVYFIQVTAKGIISNRAVLLQ